MKLKPIVIDFETRPIAPRPAYPPTPVGVAIKWPHEKRAQYLAWGHPTGNNCAEADARAALLAAWESSEPLLFHNAKFDVEVAQAMGMGPIAWHRVHDTMYHLFLDDPHADSFALKPASERLLGLPSSERDAVRDWLVDQGLVRPNAKDWGASICQAPGDLVGKYANGDIKRTLGLFNLLHPRIIASGMSGAYDREREVMPILLANEQEGIRVNATELSRDIVSYRREIGRVDAWLCKRLGNKDLNIDADADLADALEASGVVNNFVMTKTRQKSVSKANLTPDKFTDQRVARALGYRNRLATCLGTFMEPWLATSQATGGILHTSWNQVRQLGRTGNIGARTGRLSSSPNFQNIPKNFNDKNDGYKHPTHIKDLLPLPKLRTYILPDKKQIICHRDYNQQEIRIMAHFEDGVTLAAYQEDPRLDFHNFVRDEIHRVIGVKLERRAVKILNFGMIYGMGLEALSNDLGCSREEAGKIKDAQRKALPGLAELERVTKERGRSNGYVRTWGGRVYHVEPPKTVDGRLWTFEYKLLNYLIQGSAADCTKQALINYANAPHEGRFIITVHDEVNLSVPKGAVKREMALLRDCMAGVLFDLPMLSDGKTGTDWGSLTAYEEKK